jgi:hypothetical protein
MEGMNRMTEKKEPAKKPFYENIVAGRKRTQRPPKGDKSDRDDRAERGDRNERIERTERAGRTNDDNGKSRYAKNSSGAKATRDGRFAHDAARPRDGNFRRDDRTGRGDRRPRDSARDERGSPRHEGAPRSRRPFDAPETFTPIFGSLSKDTRALLDAFPEIVQSALPLDSKRLQELPTRIRELSHELTDERSDRHVGYLNDPAELSAYIRYYMWWNLVRLSRLFVSLPIELADGDAAVDLGSGPLTLPIALWMARPDLRKKNLTWYCVDISQGALAAGEEIFLALAARVGEEPWKIVRVKGESGVSLKRKVSLVASANMFNELFWDNPQPIEEQSKHHASGLASYAGANASILVIEPGVPRAGRFVSLLRDSLMRLGFSVVAPCPHEFACPFPGLRYGKWCHFVFDTSDAPAKLHKLSEDAGLSKDRAALSFVFAKRSAAAAESATEAADGIPDGASAQTVGAPAPDAAATDTVKRLSGMFHGIRVRITSDPIRLPDYNTGRYGCSEVGMVLVCGTYQAADWLNTCESGSLIEVPRPDKKNAEYDQKTGALIIRLK